METEHRPSPYRGLLPFDEDDAPFFFGRDREIRLIKANLFASSLTLFYGPSGVGKSSVLRAGAAAELRKRDDVAIIVFDRWQGDAARDLKLAARKVIDPLLEKDVRPENDSLSAYLLAAANATDRHLLLILDQFEEYFLYHPDPDPFADDLPLLINGSERISVLLSLREDALAKLDRFEGRIPSLFDNCLRVGHLDQRSARDAITKPVEKHNELHGTSIVVEEELVDEVLRQVRTDEVSHLLEQAKGLLVGKHGSTDVETPYLQLVMTRIWRKEIRRNNRHLRLATFTKRLGGTRRIIKSHLDVRMRVLGREASEVAARVFHYLVTPSGSKIAHTATDLADYAQLDTAKLRNVLEVLSGRDVRILRAIARSPGQSDESRYEIFHDVLASAILDWRVRFERKRLRVLAEQKLAEATREAEQKRLEFRAKLSKQRRFLLLFGVLAGALLLSTVAASRLYRDQRAAAEREKVIADRNEELARDLLIARNEQAALKEQFSKQLADLQKILAASKDPALRETAKSQVAPLVPEPEEPEESPDPPPSRQNLVRNPSWPGMELWATGATLRVSFLDGHRELQRRVAETAQEWTLHANLNFEFVYEPDLTAPIRVSFREPGSWAFVGTTALMQPRSPTVNLGYLSNSVSDSLLRSTVLHEFGHVLGFVEEINNGKAVLNWDEERLYRTFSAPPNNWSRQQIRQIFFTPVVIQGYREFDPTSIMMVPLTDELRAMAGVTEKPTGDLSESDKAFARKLYPGR